MTSAVLSDKIDESRGRCHLGRKCPGIVVRNDAAGLGLFFWIVVARFYTEDEVGLGAAIISAICLLALLSRLGLDFALIRFLPKAEKPVDMISSCFVLSGIVALALAAIFIAGLNLWSPALGLIREDAIFSLAFVFFALCWTSIGVDRLRLHREEKSRVCPV